MSSTFQSDRQTLRVPDINSAWVNPTKPSPPASRPRAVSHAESVTSSAFRSQPRWISRTESRPSKTGLWFRTCSSGSGRPVWVRITAERAGIVFVDHAVRRQVDEAEPAQLARGGQAVELGLARVGPEQDPGGPIVGLEEPGERLDLVARARQGGEVLVA